MPTIHSRGQSWQTNTSHATQTNTCNILQPLKGKPDEEPSRPYQQGRNSTYVTLSPNTSVRSALGKSVRLQLLVRLGDRAWGWSWRFDFSIKLLLKLPEVYSYIMLLNDKKKRRMNMAAPWSKHHGWLGCVLHDEALKFKAKKHFLLPSCWQNLAIDRT